MATIIYLYTLFSGCVTRKLSTLKRKTNILKRRPRLSPRHRSSIISTDSSTTLVNPLPSHALEDQIGGQKDKCQKTRLAFLILTIVSLGLSTGANVVELWIVNQANKRWDEDVAARVGMKFELGILAFREWFSCLISWTQSHLEICCVLFQISLRHRSSLLVELRK